MNNQTSQQDILAELKAEIRQGIYRSGDRLPAHTELIERFNSTPVTVMRAMKRLVEDGYAVTRPRLGTFVAEHPSFTRRIAIAQPFAQNAQNAVRLWRVIAEEAERLRQEEGYDLNLYYGISGDLRHNPQRSDYLRLIEDMEKERLAGIFFVAQPHDIMQTPLLTKPGLPRVALTLQESSETYTTFGMTDKELCLGPASDIFCQKRCKRLAIFTHYKDLERVPDIVTEAKQTGLDCQPHLVQFGSPHSPQTTRQVARLLCHLPERPDAIFISDDNWVEPVCQGLEDGGLHIGKDVEVAAWVNLPAPNVPYPVRWLGHDTTDILRLAADTIMAARQGQPMPRTLSVPLITE